MKPPVFRQWRIDGYFSSVTVNTLRQRQNGRQFPDDIFKCFFLNENELILIKISLKFYPKGQIDNIPSLVQIMAWRRPGDKPLSEAMVVSLLTHICVNRPHWLNSKWYHSATKWYHSFDFIYDHWMGLVLAALFMGSLKDKYAFDLLYLCFSWKQ